MSNEHGYPIWFAPGAYAKLKFQMQGAIMAVLLKHYGDTPMREKAVPELMHVIELSWKKIRGRDLPIIPRE